MLYFSYDDYTFINNFWLRFENGKVTILDILMLFSTFSIPVIKFELVKEDDKHTIAKVVGEI